MILMGYIYVNSVSEENFPIKSTCLSAEIVRDAWSHPIYIQELASYFSSSKAMGLKK